MSLYLMSLILKKRMMEQYLEEEFDTSLDTPLVGFEVINNRKIAFTE